MKDVYLITKDGFGFQVTLDEHVLSELKARLNSGDSVTEIETEDDEN